MRVGSVMMGSRSKPITSINLPIDTTSLYTVYKSCYDYTKQLAKDFGINISGNDWQAELKRKLNEGYGDNNRNNKLGYEFFSDPEFMYALLINNGTDLINALATQYNSFGGAKALGQTLEKSYQDLLQAKKEKKNVSAKVQYVKGNLDEFLASALRGVQRKGATVVNTESKQKPYSMSIVYDIEQEIPEIGRNVYWEVKKGIQPNFMASKFHFGDFSMVQSFLGKNATMLKNLRKEILDIIYTGRADSILGKKNTEQILLESYVQMACAYIAERLKEGQVLFTNSKGDINFGFEIIAGFLNFGMLRIEQTNFHGKISEEELTKSDEQYLIDMKAIASRHKDDVIDKVLDKLGTKGNRIKISVWYGKK